MVNRVNCFGKVQIYDICLDVYDQTFANSMENRQELRDTRAIYNKTMLFIDNQMGYVVIQIAAYRMLKNLANNR